MVLEEGHPKPLPYHFSPLLTYRGFNWFKNIESYLEIRYPPIVNRLKNVFRYVDLHPDNSSTFSYEFASLLRDIGSTISSVLDSYVRGVRKNDSARLDITDYRDFLSSEIENIEKICVVLNANFDVKNLLPFKGFNSEKISSAWWDAYNAVKHTDINLLQKGCLSNVIYGFCALTILYRSTFPYSPGGVLEETQGIISNISVPYEFSKLQNVGRVFPIAHENLARAEDEKNGI